MEELTSNDLAEDAILNESECKISVSQYCENTTRVAAICWMHLVRPDDIVGLIRTALWTQFGLFGVETF